MAFGRRIPATGPDDTYKKQPPHIRRLIDAMQALFDDASSIAETIRQRRSLIPADVPADETHLFPIRCKDNQRLFEHKDETGEIQYSTYCFTKDFDLKTVTTQGQFKLLDLYTMVIFANRFINHDPEARVPDSPKLGKLKNAIDDILVKSAYFVSFFRSYVRSTDILLRRFDKAGLENVTREHVEDWRKRMEGAKRLMFRPERLAELAPDAYPCFMVAGSGPWREGQMAFNGVHFPPTEAAMLREKLGRIQADAIADDMRARQA